MCGIYSCKKCSCESFAKALSQLGKHFAHICARGAVDKLFALEAKGNGIEAGLELFFYVAHNAPSKKLC
jgi:hypothetical protein